MSRFLLRAVALAGVGLLLGGCGGPEDRSGGISQGEADFGSILLPGETWSQGAAKVTMKPAEFLADGRVRFRWSVENVSASQGFVPLCLPMAVDSLGNECELTLETEMVTLRPGESADMAAVVVPETESAEWWRICVHQRTVSGSGGPVAMGYGLAWRLRVDAE